MARPGSVRGSAGREHAIFEREGEHLSCEVPISFATAALGGTLEVPTLDGDVTIKIPAESQSGRVFRLRDKGVKPVRGGARGDLFCKVVIETPVKLSAEQRELIRRLEETLRGGQHAPRQKGFLEGVRVSSQGAKKNELYLARAADRCTGRMGQALVRVAKERPHVRITGAATHAGSVHLGRDVGELAGVGRLGVLVTADVAAALADCDCAIDFSQSPATASNLAACVVAGKPLLVGTTGPCCRIETGDRARGAPHCPADRGQHQPGVTLLMELVRSGADPAAELPMWRSSRRTID